jgi:hypothetical protein
MGARGNPDHKEGRTAMKLKGRILPLLATAALVGTAWGTSQVQASDHDDGTTDMKTQNTNLTDLYVFTEKSQNPSASDEDLIFIMNANPRALARQNYYFNTGARYEFHVTRVGDNDDVPSGKDDVVLRYEFGAPDASMKQKVTVTAVRDGQTMSAASTAGGQDIVTTPLDAAPTNNDIKLGEDGLTVFAGLREDPFFFDVEQYFRVRDAAAKGAAGSVTFRSPGVDFTAGYNVLSIVTRVPRKFLQGANSSATSFDVWETISVKK